MSSKREKFRYVIMGAGHISEKFCRAVGYLEECEVSAVASRKMERAKGFAEKNNVAHAYDNYEEMLEKEKPDAVYIGVTQSAHYELVMLCLKHNVGVICEKAMFMKSEQAEKAFRKSREQNVFVMEGLWSRFLPAVKTARKWIQEGRIGKPKYSNISIGFIAPEGNDNRYFSRELGGGVSYDITVYAYELTVYMIDQPIEEIQVSALWGETGVDVGNQITIRFSDTLASLTTTFEAPVEEKMVVYGDDGYIVIPQPHMAKEAYLYSREKTLTVHFKDEITENGFVYEAREVMECIRAGKRESSVVPQKLTLDCARLFDKIAQTNGR